MTKYCLIYSYLETKDSKKNLEFFVKNGVSVNDDIDYYFIINNHHCSVKFPSNVKIIHRDNIGRDFAAFKHCLDSINRDEYDYFIFMNDTVIGPFIPRYTSKNTTWYSMFCSLLSDQIKLSGLTINYFPWGNKSPNLEHVQSMMFCTDKVGINILHKTIFNLTAHDYESIYKQNRRNYITKFEIGMSQKIREHEFKISALYVCDIKQRKTDDVWYNNHYFKSTMNPFETMFIKKNRVNSDIINLYIKMFS